MPPSKSVAGSFMTAAGIPTARTEPVLSRMEPQSSPKTQSAIQPEQLWDEAYDNLNISPAFGMEKATDRTRQGLSKTQKQGFQEELLSNEYEVEIISMHVARMKEAWRKRPATPTASAAVFRNHVTTPLDSNKGDEEKMTGRNSVAASMKRAGPN
ncbi:hypothetical protein DL768_008746 [Monosporascus sp. mg162]|nr:hypothetical protein DL768_008746 [Monosporascus sp. mg162]